jgi:heme/copper-type cytochrome/quinol oxidase subunit 2
MSNRARYIWLAFFAIVGTFLAIGAWHQSPGEDPDNQGGYALVFLFFVILLSIYVPVIMRTLAARFRRKPQPESNPRAMRNE